MKKSVTSNACTCHSYLIIGEKSSSEANKDTVWCANFTNEPWHHSPDCSVNWVIYPLCPSHNPSCSRICRFPCYMLVYSVMHRHVRFPLLWGRVGVSAKQSNKYLAVPFWSVRKGSLWSLSWKTRHTYDQSMFFSVDRWFGRGAGGKLDMALNFRFGQCPLLALITTCYLCCRLSSDYYGEVKQWENGGWVTKKTNDGERGRR